MTPPSRRAGTTDADAASLSPGGPPRWLLWTLAVISVAALAFAVGRFTTFGTSEQLSSPTTDSAEAGFARDMQVHHAQAIEMAMTIHRTTENEDVRMLAYDIATAQAGQRGEFASWLIAWGLPASGEPLMTWMADTDAHAQHGGAPVSSATDAELRAQMGMATDDELARLSAATGSEADCLFLELMIRHHEGAIPMARALREIGRDARALQVAGAIESTQTAEIDAMNALRADLACR